MIYRTLMKLTAADLIDLQRLTESWETYTTTWTSDGTLPVLGNGTLTGRKLVVGKTVWNMIELSMGSTTTFGTGNYFFGLSHTARTISSIIGPIYMLDASGGAAANKSGVVTTFSPASSALCISSADTTVGATVPHTWAVSDKMSILAHYEVA